MEFIILISAALWAAAMMCLFAMHRQSKMWEKLAERRGEDLAEMVDLHNRCKKAKEARIYELHRELEEARKNDHRDAKGRFKKAPAKKK